MLHRLLIVMVWAWALAIATKHKAAVIANADRAGTDRRRFERSRIPFIAGRSLRVSDDDTSSAKGIQFSDSLSKIGVRCQSLIAKQAHSQSRFKQRLPGPRTALSACAASFWEKPRGHGCPRSFP